MKSKYYILILLSGIALSLFSQNPTIQYSYDADGNMESRNTVTLRSAQIDGQIDEAEPEAEESFSVKLRNQQITVYPNPTQGEICVEIMSLNPEEENFMHLFNSSGHLIEKIKIESQRTYLQISGASGIYLLNIHLRTNISKWKIIKQ